MTPRKCRFYGGTKGLVTYLSLPQKATPQGCRMPFTIRSCITINGNSRSVVAMSLLRNANRCQK